MEEVLDQGIDQDVSITKDNAMYRFKDTNVEELSGKVEKYLLGKGYKLESGTPENAIYGKGNKTLRILFGAFVKRFTWKVTVVADGNTTVLNFIKDEKGYWGGAIGVSQVKNEFKRITDALTQFHASFKKA
ncbi:MAG: hypothetical protein MK078_10360 [Crocinitomicaceae bacterium]|nr:hypothetical protein [Crocinitomicaceae bacterium]